MGDTPLSKKRLSLIFSTCLAAAVIIAVQMGLILARGEALCLNEGCRTVERLTLVSPLLFNAAGLGYFLLLLALVQASRKRENTQTFLLLLLLAGMAVEGVLFSYQHYVAKTFCSYCLVILAVICTLNAVAGRVQVSKGAIVALSIVAAFSVLSFDDSTGLIKGRKAPLDGGSVAIVGRPQDNSSPQHYLFFSKDCPHCQNVIAKLAEYPLCELHLNPIDEPIETLPMVPQGEKRSFLPAINRLFLSVLQLNVVPVLYSKGEDKGEIIKGDGQILGYLERNCTAQGNGTFPAEQQTLESAPLQMSPRNGEGHAAGDCTLREECLKE